MVLVIRFLIVGAVTIIGSIGFAQLDCKKAQLASVPEILKSNSGEDPCYMWVKSVYGRVARVQVASGAVWSRNTAHKTGLLLTARHVLGDYPDSPGVTIQGYFGQPSLDPFSQPELFVFQPNKEATDVLPFRNQTFRLFTQTVSKDEYQNHYANIQPKNDFVVAVMTQRLLAPEQIGDGSIDLSPLDVFDPQLLTQTAPTFSDPIVGEEIIILGFPRDTAELAFNGIMAYSTGKVLSTADAKDLIIKDPEEGKIAFDEKVEFAVEARSLAGMSGGGAFDRKGRFLGTLVRGNDVPASGRYFTRVVRINYVRELLKIKLSLLSEPQSNAVKSWLEK